MAQFVWPSRGNFSTVAYPKIVNVFDRLEVTYNSTWPSLNLTLSCLAGSTSSNWLYFNVAANPILSDGTYAITSIDSLNFNIHQYPTNCKFKLTKYGSNNIATDGDLFEVDSVAGTSTTYKMPSTATHTSQDATSTTGKSTATATNTSAAKSSSASATRTSAASTSSPSAVSGSSSGLSVGAQAGIGVGIGVLVLIIGLLTFLVFRQRRKLRQRQTLPDPPPVPQTPQFEPSQNMKPELSSQTVAASPSIYKYELDSQQQQQQQQRVELEAPRREQMPSGPHELG